MQLDWIDENERRKYKERKAATRELIRRRATQAAVLTRQKQRRQTGQPRCQAQEVQSWVVHDSHLRSSSSKLTKSEGFEAPAGIAERRTLSNPWEAAQLPRSLSSISSTSLLLQRLIDVFQGEMPTHNVFQTLLSRSAVPDEQVRYFKVLALTDAEYLQAINSRYGRSACLDAAIDCLTARIKDLLAGTAGHLSTLRVYTRALRILQQSLATDPFPERFEIYYAIPLLVLFELLGPADQFTYLTHGRGAVHLLHFIGPDGMKTELDRTLLAMQSDIMVIENLRDSYAHCCATPEWQRALWRTIRDELPPGTSRSEANVTLNIIATALPDAFNHVEMAVTRSNININEKLRNELQMIMAQLENWQQRWESVLRALPWEGPSAPTPKVLLAVFLMYTAILHRLSAAAPARLEQRLSSESKALEVANDAVQIVADSKFHSIISQTRLAVVAKLVCSVTDTSNAWQQAVRRTTPDQPINRTLFVDWCVRLGRENAIEAPEASTLAVG